MDDGQRMWLQPETLQRADEMAQRALRTPVPDCEVRRQAAFMERVPQL